MPNEHSIIDKWYLENLVCPRDHLKLNLTNEALACPNNHGYPIVDGVPVMLLDDVRQTLRISESSLRLAKEKLKPPDGKIPPLYMDSLGLDEEEKKGILGLYRENLTQVDPVVSYIIGATSGIVYRRFRGKLKSYPIPDINLPRGNSQNFLDIGCNWGRWCIAASRKGYNTVGIDPSLGAIMAARRVSENLGLSNKYLVADGRFLPFADNHFCAVFSYSVLQHFSKDDARVAILEAARVLRPKGISLIQMPNAFGIMSIYRQARRGFRDPKGFEVRYWTIPALRKTFNKSLGKTTILADCYFGLGLQISDFKLMPPLIKLILLISQLLKKISATIPPLIYLADSVYVRSECEK